jgi:fluoroacetyl-CoA thioesterase
MMCNEVADDRSITPGMVSEATQKVTPEMTASHLGSGSLRVYATPAMCALVERTCATMVALRLTETQTTVGVKLHIHHLAPTPVGSEVRIRAEVTKFQEKIIVFKAQIWDEVELVGEAEHHRFVIEEERFLRRVRTKSQQPADQMQNTSH